MHRLIIVLFVLVLPVIVAVALGVDRGGEAHDGTHGTLSLDHATADNTASAVGTIQQCASKPLSAGQEFTVDLVVQGIPGSGEDMGAFQTRITFDPSVIDFVDASVSDATAGAQFFLEKAGASPTLLKAENAAGDWTIGGFQLGPNRGNNGDGLIARLTFRAVGNGLTNISLDPSTLYIDVSFTNHGFEIVNSGAAGINQTCEVAQPTATPAVGAQPTATPPVGGQPTATPPVGGQPTATPTGGPSGPTDTDDTVAPDPDGDGVPLVDDSCSDTPADAGVDPSGCSDAQLQQLKEETSEQLIEEATAGLNLDATLDTVTVGGSTDLLAAFADQNGELVSGVDVTFKVEQQPGSDANLEGQTELTVTSGADGVAAAKLNVGTAPGAIVVSATAQGETVTFTITVTAARDLEGTPPLASGQATQGDDDGQPLWPILAAGLAVGALALAGLAWGAWRLRNRST